MHRSHWHSGHGWHHLRASVRCLVRPDCLQDSGQRQEGRGLRKGVRDSRHYASLRRVLAARHHIALDLVAFFQRSHCPHRQHPAASDHHQHCHGAVCLLRRDLLGLLWHQQEDPPSRHPERDTGRRSVHRSLVQPVGQPCRSNGSGGRSRHRLDPWLQQATGVCSEEPSEGARLMRSAQPPRHACSLGFDRSLNLRLNSCVQPFFEASGRLACIARSLSDRRSLCHLSNGYNLWIACRIYSQVS